MQACRILVTSPRFKLCPPSPTEAGGLMRSAGYCMISMHSGDSESQVSHTGSLSEVANCQWESTGATVRNGCAHTEATVWFF